MATAHNTGHCPPGNAFVMPVERLWK